MLDLQAAEQAQEQIKTIYGTIERLPYTQRQQAKQAARPLIEIHKANLNRYIDQAIQAVQAVQP